MLEKFTPEEVAGLLRGETITVSTQLESSEGHPVVLECYVIPTESPRKWILITALANQVAIGFIDARYFPDTQSGLVEAPHLSRTMAFDAPHSEIRATALDDGFTVIEEERNRNVGQVLFDTLKRVLRGLDVKRMSVNQPKERSRSFYQRNNGKPHISGFGFDLDSE
jgi:hypothetical protein